MKTCPQCRRSFGDNFVFCDQDGAKLRRAPSKRYLFAIVALLAASALAIGVFTLVAAYVTARVSAKLTNVSVHLDGTGGVSPLGSVSLLLSVRIQNDSFLPFTLRSAGLNCSGSNIPISRLSWPSQGEKPVRIPPHGSAEIGLRLSGRAANPFSPFAIGSQRITAECQGKARLSAWGIQTERQLSFQQEL